MAGIKKDSRVGDWVTVKVSGEETAARIRAVTGKYCKLELTKNVHVDGHRTRVIVVRLKDVRR